MARSISNSLSFSSRLVELYGMSYEKLTRSNESNTRFKNFDEEEEEGEKN